MLIEGNSEQDKDDDAKGIVGEKAVDVELSRGCRPNEVHSLHSGVLFIFAVNPASYCASEQ